MRITILVPGSRGDTQPGAILGAELARRGNDVTLASTDDLTWMGDALGLRTVPLAFDTRSFLRSDAGQALLTKRGARGYGRGVLEQKMLIATAWQAAVLEACRSADVIVASNLVMDEASCVAEAMGVPFVGLHFAPWRPNRAYAAHAMTVRRLVLPLRLATHHLVAQAEWKATAAYVNTFRRSLDLPETDLPLPTRLAAGNTLEIQAFGAGLVPELHGWATRFPVVGFLTPTAEQRLRWHDVQPDEALDEWLDAGDPPVFFGFGSMPVRDPGAMLAMLTDVCEQLGVRGLIGAGWSAMPIGVAQRAADRMRLVGPLDHTSVMPRCSVAVHHGGAGTTAASIGAGLPTVVCAVAFDQPFWGQRLRDQGLGTWLPFRKADADRLVDAVRPLLDEAVAARTRLVGARLAVDDAASAAARLVEDAGRGSHSDR
ncbi:glycosyltransferase [Curtobacterium sp. MCPF17_021]|uniref:glycosyltransferase n=1 Tax=Curtobacterium sp. MCPF17_021 TaxID=2175639 RepID=UPI000DAA9546|nr:glycosyltransferase [Curtobacterium sp. MCPF17_021]WIE83705.1 glycosyltransferase [Curtobacterium sp. MCPF17_021]